MACMEMMREEWVDVPSFVRGKGNDGKFSFDFIIHESKHGLERKAWSSRLISDMHNALK